MTRLDDIMRGGDQRPRRPPDCEFTELGSETEAVDCWADATYRYVDGDGLTKGLRCDEHRGKGVPRGLTEEEISAGL